MGVSRKQRSTINIIVNVGYQFFSIVMSFVLRTVFIHVLDSGYLGINSLFTNILSILSLAELGVGTAMTYSMYRPLAENNHDKLAALTQYFKSVYRIIAVFVLVMGLAFLPFLPKIINLKKEIQHISFFYLLYLIDTVLSYLCVYKTAVLSADQKAYKLNLFRICFDTARIIMQLFALIFFKSFTMYICIQIACSIGNNFWGAYIAGKEYPYIINKVPLEKSEKSRIWSNVKDMFSYKIGGVILNNTDQLLISTLVSTEVVGLYSNYYMPVKAIMGVTSAIFIAVQASVGNLAVEKDEKKQYEIFKVLDLSSFWIYGFCSICFAVLLPDFIHIWLGNNYVLSNSLVYIMSITYYFTGILYPIWCYRETVGLFAYTKNILFYASVINIIASIVLGKVWGIEGILLATVIARLCTNIWYEPLKLFEIYFHKRVFKYYEKKIKELLTLVACVVIINKLSDIVNIQSEYLRFGCKLGLCLVIPNIIFFIFNYRKDEFKYIMGYFKALLRKKQQRSQ